MPREGTKAAEIMRLDAEGLSTREIAERVGCDTAYVRVVARQRKGASSANDRRYRASERGLLARDKDRVRKNNTYHSLPKDVRSATFKAAYRAARSAGADVRKAGQFGTDAVMALARKTANA